LLFSPRQRSAGEYERLYHDYTVKMNDFRQRHKGGMAKSLFIPGLGVAQAALFISQFNAVSALVKEKVRRH
jgi:hypothetical protein